MKPRPDEPAWKGAFIAGSAASLFDKTPPPACAIDFHVGEGSFQIRTDEKGGELEDGDRYLLLEIDMRERKKAHTAIRLSAIPWGEKFLWPQPVLEIDGPDNPPP